ncbi:MAG: LysM peptidoglycan-binding domain-containing protein [Chloroflexi bacterium]|nr:LysM peptidoglycan-binding domain-containing protein [Chloroflexota bacterium]
MSNAIIQVLSAIISGWWIGLVIRLLGTSLLGLILLQAWSATLGAPAVIAAPESHRVVPGETLSGIAERHGVTVAELAAANGIKTLNLVFPGQVLAIPARTGTATGAAPEAAASPVTLQVLYRTQFDGSQYEESNCGPATLGMLMTYYDRWASTDALRQSVNESTGYWGLDGGADWESLVYAAEARGLRVKGLYEGPKRYRKWTLTDVLEEARAGRPVMLLVRYWSLPGHEQSSWWGDHYIVFLGQTDSGEVLYHDSAFEGNVEGAYRTMSQERLLRAWTGTVTGIRYSAMVLEAR